MAFTITEGIYLIGNDTIKLMNFWSVLPEFQLNKLHFLTLNSNKYQVLGVKQVNLLRQLSFLELRTKPLGIYIYSHLTCKQDFLRIFERLSGPESWIMVSSSLLFSFLRVRQKWGIFIKIYFYWSETLTFS